MPQKPFVPDDFVPIGEDFVPEVGTDFAPEGTGGHWEKRGPHTMWIPDNKVDLANRPDAKLFDTRPITDFIDRMRNYAADKASTGPFPWLQAAGASLATEPLRFITEALSEPDVVTASGALLGKIGPKSAENISIPSNTIRGLLPEHSATASPKFIAGPTGTVAPYAPEFVPLSGEGNIAGQIKNPLYEAAAKTVTRGEKGKFVSTRTPIYNQQGQALPDIDVLPSAVKTPRIKVQPDGTFVDTATNAPVTPAPEALKTSTEKTHPLREAYDLSRGLTAAFDISAPGRQGVGLIGTRNWFKAWVPMFKSMKSADALDAVNYRLAELPHIRSGLAKQTGLPLDWRATLSEREELIRSRLAEKVPLVKASNRAYTGYLNHLRANTFNDYVDDAIAQGLDPYTDRKLAQNIADLVGDLTGRGRLKFDIALPGGYSKTKSFEQVVKPLTDILFAPRLIASRIRMLNPSTYIMLDPFTRRKALYGALRMGAFWTGTAALAKAAGADVSTDPVSADFGKIRVGNARQDVAGGFQQYLVLLARMVTGKYTLTTSKPGTEPKTQEFGSKFGGETRMSTLERFASNKLHPSAKFAYDLAATTMGRPMHIGDRILQMYMPMVVGDLKKIAQEDPRLLPWLAPTTLAGFGSQVYDKGRDESVYLPKEYDVTFKGGSIIP